MLASSPILHVETEAGLDTGQCLERVLCVPVWCPVQCSVASWASWKQCPVLLSLQVDTQPCRKLFADNSLPFSSYTLFRVVNFRCADMRLLFFQFITIKAVFKCNIQTTVSLPCVSLQSVSAGVVFCKFSVRECSYELSFELSSVVKWKWIAVGITLGIIVMELDLGWGYLLYFINVMGGQTTSIKIITN